MSSKSRIDYVNSSPAICGSFKEYVHQVGGHGMKSSKKYQILNNGSGILYKPVQNFPKGEKEIEFYQSIFSDRCDKSVAVIDLKKFIPKFLGLFSCNDPLKENLYIGIEDLLLQFKSPSVADVKIGQKSYEPIVSNEKRFTEMEKYKWRETVGFLITGIKVLGPEAVFLNRYHGRSLTPEQVYHQGIKVFLGSNPFRAQMLATAFNNKLEALLTWFKCQREMSFIASSVLMAYESEEVTHNGGVITNGTVKTCNGFGSETVIVKFIDFTHVLPVTDHDHNCIYGLESLIRYFNRVRNDSNY